MKKKLALAFASILALGACAGKVDYVRPSASPGALSNQRVVDRPREAVWNSAVPELGKQFYVINNLDKSSGLINISYSGDPEQYVDCGRVTSYVKNARGERTYDFPASKGQQSYEVMNPNGLFFIDRKMQLEGRINLVFEEVDGGKTRVTANTRYVVTRSMVVRAASGQMPGSRSDSINFNSGRGASFPANSEGNATECVSSGRLEQEILSVIK